MRLRPLLSLCLLLFSFYASRAQTPAIDSLLKIIQQDKKDAVENKALNVLASEYTRIDMARAKAYLYASMHMAADMNNRILLSNAYAQMVMVQMNTGKPDSALYFLTALKTLSTDPSTPSVVNTDYNFSAGLYYKRLGNFKEALHYMLESLNGYKPEKIKEPSASDKVWMAGQCLNIGNTYNDLGDYKNALQYHLKGLGLFEEAGNKKGISFCYQSISTDFIQLGQFKQALPYQQKALDLKKELNDKRGVGTAIAGMGSIYKGLQDYAKALSFFEDGQKIFQEMKLTPEEAKSNLDIGKMYVLQNDAKTATEYFERSRALALQMKDSSLLAAIDAETVSMQNTISTQKRTEQKLMNSLRTSIEMGDKNTELASYKYLADHYAAIKQYDKALEYTNKLHEASDSLQNRDVQLQIKRMEEQFNLDKKEKEIALLKKDQQLNQAKLQEQRTFQYGAAVLLILIILIGFLLVNRYRVVQKAKRLIEMEKMRNQIARDLHDDIGSSLSNINILTKVMQDRAPNDYTINSGLQKIKDNSASVMENISDIVWTINPSNDSLEKVIYRMKEFAADILEPLNIKCIFTQEGDFRDLKPDLRKKKDIYLVFKEAINNAAKYSHCTAVEVSIRKTDSGIALQVHDNGDGFDKRLVRTGNGLVNMQERARQLDGELLIDTGPGKGTTIELRMLSHN